MNNDENFTSYVDFEGNQFLCVVNQYLAKLFPLEKGNSFKAYYDTGTNLNPQWLFGFDEDYYEIALFAQHGIQPASFARYSQFGVPIIVKSTSNVKKYDLHTFDAISFQGGSIDSVYNPKIAVNREHPDRKDFDGARTIEIKPFNEYSQTYPIRIDNENANLLYSVSQDGKAENFTTSELGKVTSFIRIEFEKSQDINKLVICYNVIKGFLSLLIGQQNVTFEVALHKRTEQGKSQEIAICSINERYRNYCQKRSNKVIPLDFFKDKLSVALTLFDTEQPPFLAFLPSDNSESNHISYTNVQDLCTALEMEYSLKKFPFKGDDIAKRLIKTLKEDIKEFAKENPDAEESLYSVARSSVKYISLSLTDRIWMLYGKYQKQIDTICDKHNILKLDKEKIHSFVNLRNSITHSGLIDWNGNEKIYLQLKCLLYFAIFERIGFSATESYEPIYQLM